MAGCGATTSGTPSSTAVGQVTPSAPDPAKSIPSPVAPVPKHEPTSTWTDSPEEVEQWRRGNLVGEVAQRLVPDPERPGIGYAGSKVSGDQLKVWLWWKGPVPPAVQAVADDGKDGVEVRVASAPYNYTELQAGISRVMTLSGPVDDRLKRNGVRVLAAGPELEGTGIWVTYDRSFPGVADHTRARELLQDVAGISVIEVEAIFDRVVHTPLRVSSLPVGR